MSYTVGRRISNLERAHQRAIGAWIRTLSRNQLQRIADGEDMHSVCTVPARVEVALAWTAWRRGQEDSGDDVNNVAVDLDGLTADQLNRLVDGESQAVVCPEAIRQQ